MSLSTISLPEGLARVVLEGGGREPQSMNSLCSHFSPWGGGEEGALEYIHIPDILRLLHLYIVVSI